MSDHSPRDAIDRIVADLHEHFPGLDTDGFEIVGRVLRLARLLEARREQQLSSRDLTVADFDVLATIRRTAADSAVKVGAIQGSLMLSSGGMTKRLDRLEKVGLLERRRDPDDRRGVLIALTGTGRTLIDEALPAVVDAEARMVAAAVTSETARTGAIRALRQLLIDRDTVTLRTEVSITTRRRSR